MLISVLALLAAGLSFCENHKQADVAQKAFEAGVRPWVYAIGNPGNHNFTYDAKDGTTTFILLLKIKGIGQVPAQHVFGAGSFLPYEPNMEGKLAAQKASCDKYILWYKGRKKSGILFPDQTIFPGQEGIVMALISNGETPFQGVDVNTIIAPLLVGCIFYTDQTGEFHRTGFIYQLWRKDPAISGERGFALREQPIPTNELVLAADELGAGPAD